MPPQQHLGFRVGQDSMLATWSQITGYFQHLATASPRVRVDTLGPTTGGRPFVLATISDPANLARREQIMAGQRLLADPRQLSAGEEARLLREQPAVILINMSIHGTEVGASQMSMELAWMLATDSALGEALKNVVVLIVPGANPDGVDIVGDWYRGARGTAWDGTGPPWLYHPYVGHDNNRDWFMLTQVETRMLTRVLYRQWFPEVFWDVHQMGSTGARMFLPPFADPVNPNLDPAIVAGMNLIGVTMAQALHDAGKTGVSHSSGFDLWWHGGARSTPTRHNMIGILSEAASARLASPNCLPAAQMRQPERGVNYPAPWTPGCWRLRDIVDYELIASTALVRLAAGRRAEFIQRFVDAGRRQIALGRREPSAFVLPADSGDAGARAHLANLLIAAGIEVHRATRPLAADGATYPAGSYVVRMDQPFRAHAKDLLERQQYPERRAFPGGPQLPPYDVAGWTLPLQMGVAAEAVRDPLASAGLERIDTAVVAAGRISGRGEIALLANRSTAEISTVWRALEAGGTVDIASAAFTAEGRAWPAGTLIVRGARAAVEAAATAGGFDAAFARAVRIPEGSAHVARVPRLGVYRSWNGSMDEGWTRWVFEQLGVRYVTVTDSGIRAGALRDLDVVLLPSENEAALMQGRRSNTAPARITGGLGQRGTAALRSFLEGGGTVIALDQASRYAISQLGAPARALRTARGATTTEEGGEPATRASQDTGSVFRFYAPGSIFEAAVERSHPIASGMGSTAQLYFINSTIMEAGEGSRAVLSWPAGRNPLLSGYVDGWDVLSNRAALIDAPVGRGRAILFGFRPQHRGQTHGTYRLLTNAILYGAVSNASGR